MWPLIGSLEEYHSAGLHRVARAKPIEIHPAGDPAGLPKDRILASRLPTVHKSIHPTPGYIVDRQMDMGFLPQFVTDSRNRVERIGDNRTQSRFCHDDLPLFPR